MTLKEFLDAGYALLVDEYRKLGMPLFEALSKTATWRAGGDEEGAAPGDVPAVSENTVVAQNEQSLRDFEALGSVLAGGRRA